MGEDRRLPLPTFKSQEGIIKHGRLQLMRTDQLSDARLAVRWVWVTGRDLEKRGLLPFGAWSTLHKCPRLWCLELACEGPSATTEAAGRLPSVCGHGVVGWNGGMAKARVGRRARERRK